MIILFILVIVFIGIILHLSFANEQPEIKIGGLTFFISLFTIGPFFSGIISIPAYAPNSPDNTIEVVSIVVSGMMAGIAVGVYRLIEEIKFRAREKKHIEELEKQRKERELFGEEKKKATEERKRREKEAQRKAAEERARSSQLEKDSVKEKNSNSRKKEYKGRGLSTEIKGASNMTRCPVCDGYLVERQGRDELFYGCSNYPRCCYTQSLDGSSNNLERLYEKRRREIDNMK